jgi:hypothetical protein
LQEQLFTRRLPGLPTPRPAAVQVSVLGPLPEQLTSTQPPATGSTSATAGAHRWSCSQPLLGSSMQCHHQSEAEPCMLQDFPLQCTPHGRCYAAPRSVHHGCSLFLELEAQYCALVWGGLPLHRRRSCAPGCHCPLLPPHRQPLPAAVAARSTAGQSSSRLLLHKVLQRQDTACSSCRHRALGAAGWLPGPCSCRWGCPSTSSAVGYQGTGHCIQKVPVLLLAAGQ